MKRKRSSVEQIVTVVKQHEMGDSAADTGRKLGIAEQTFHRWKKQYGGLGFERLPTNTDHCLSFCIRTGMHTHTGGISTKNTGVYFEARNSTERLP